MSKQKDELKEKYDKATGNRDAFESQDKSDHSTWKQILAIVMIIILVSGLILSIAPLLRFIFPN